ncbi:copper resistance system multicopper oxidase [Thalassomonas sp. RHCl1]|uniref:copper resistance system multicopper oxidase n=1 Tax=Thalassomonas sp. RHCl1 TaxID=2995320 RepID=UPI00248C0533|nr:copper resistance system multicopper oxidase [Thalassomonas sp. RHCl1]
MFAKNKAISPLGLSRRRFVLGAGSALLLTAIPFSKKTLAGAVSRGLTTLSGKVFDLSLDYKTVNFTGSERLATVINQTLPGPVLRWKEGETVTLRVKNNLAETSSLHWHGLILESAMDGVPGISFDGIKPGETFEYKFKVQQSGTYWYHSHSGFQEQTGMYGAIVIDPQEPDPVAYDNEYVVMLTDWTDEDPTDVYAKLKKMSGYYNFSERTAGDLLDEIKKNGVVNTFNARAMWNKARMSDRDLSDVTSHTYTYLMNGNTPELGWQALFNKGEKIRLRFINGAAMTIFDVRIPGLKMTVVASDGQNIQPVTVDEFRMGVAETYDVIVEPDSEQAYCIFAQSIDRTGYAVGNLTPDANVIAEVPKMDTAAVLGHADMGMDMSAMAGMDHSAMPGMKQPEMSGMKKSGMDHSGHQMKDMAAGALGLAGFGSNSEIKHVKSEFGPHVDMRASTPKSGLYDPGIGLRQHQKELGRKVLNYGDIVGLQPTSDPREPGREIQLHLTGNMSRYMWSMNGIKFADAEPLQLKYGERLRITLVNDTMMAHPMHLHGMWSELETGEPGYIPKKHTVLVQPGSKISYLVSADAMGGWAYHCHLLYHMLGMFRKVVVS